MNRKPTMIALLLASSLAVGSAFAQAPADVSPCTGPGYRMGQGAGHAMHHGPRHGVMGPQQGAARLAEIKEALKLQPAQIEAWNGFEAQVTAMRNEHIAQRQQMQKLRNDPDALADYRVTMLQARAKSAADANAARKALVATLTPEQKTAFDSFRRGQMGRSGQSGPGHRHGYGPGPQG